MNRSKRLDGVANATPMVQFLVPALSTYCRRASLIPVFSWLAPPLREANRDLVLASHVRAAHLLAQAVTSVILEDCCQRQTAPAEPSAEPGGLLVWGLCCQAVSRAATFFLCLLS